MKYLVMALLLAGAIGCSSPDDTTTPDASQPDASPADVLDDATRDDAGDDTPDVGSEPDATHDAESDAAGDTGDEPDTTGDVEPEPDATEPDASEPPKPTARTYCETTAEMFCDYYMRCGRMHAATFEDCLEIFDEQCNMTYEPQYVALEDAGLLALSEEGLAVCREHLETVECRAQLNDLDGPCAAVWTGLARVGEACSAGIGSFACEPGSTCVVGLNLCGTCQPTVGAGEECAPGGPRCEATATCVEGRCVERALQGEACDAGQPCVLGTSCIDGICGGYTVVTVGEGCNATHRCPYNAVCMGGVCRAMIPNGEPCTQPGQCRAGYCDMEDGHCRPLLQTGEPCRFPIECESGSCQRPVCEEDDLDPACQTRVCGSLPNVCFAASDE